MILLTARSKKIKNFNFHKKSLVDQQMFFALVPEWSHRKSPDKAPTHCQYPLSPQAALGSLFYSQFFAASCTARHQINASGFWAGYFLLIYDVDRSGNKYYVFFALLCFIMKYRITIMSVFVEPLWALWLWSSTGSCFNCCVFIYSLFWIGFCCCFGVVL